MNSGDKAPFFSKEPGVFMDNLLAKCDLSPNRPLSVVYFSKGLSLNDLCLVVPRILPSLEFIKNTIR